MATSLENVTGIGPATAKILTDSGITSAEDLAARQVEEVAAVRGFSTVRAAQVLAAARELFVLTPVAVKEGPETQGKTKKPKITKVKKAEKTAQKDNSKKKGKKDKKKAKNSKQDVKTDNKKKIKKKSKKGK